MRRLSGIDADMLYGETPSHHMHVAALMVLDPSTAPAPFGIEPWKRLVLAHLADLPPLHQRLVEVPLGLDQPLWVEDPHFHLDRHVRHVALPAPGGMRELATLVGDLSSYKLDRSGPPWDMWFIEGLEGERVAVLFRIHHACLDGATGSLMMSRLFSSAPEEAPAVSEDTVRPAAEPTPAPLSLLARGLRRRAGTPLRMARTVGHTVRSVREALTGHRGTSWADTPLPFRAPRTSLNGTVTPRRSVALASVPLAEVKRVKAATGVKVNDVVLALAAGSLRHYLEARGELPTSPLIAAVPVSTRGIDDADSFGNLVSGLFASLATHVADPLGRLREIHRSMSESKQLFASGVEDVVMEWADIPSPGLVAIASRLTRGSHLGARLPPLFNLLVSNVPGPAYPLFAAGARLEGCFPIGPLIGNVALNLTVLSHGDRVDFGFLGCPDVIPDLWEIADGIPAALVALAEAVDAAPLPPGEPAGS